jgi:predicted nucleotidyltransferase
MFTQDERAAASDRILEIARSDPRVVAAAVIGSLAFGGGDRWSDIDLTFAIDDDAPPAAVLDDWASRLATELDAVVLFDLPADVSVTPASAFGPGGPKFRLLFGEATATPGSTPSPVQELFGWAIAFAREARACIERARWWQAEHSINAVRDNALALACHRRGLPARFGRGFDDLPAEVLARFERARARSFDRDDLLEALSTAAEGLIGESDEVGDVAVKAAAGVRALIAVEA